VRAAAEAADAARQLDEALKRGAVSAPLRPLLAARGVTAAPLASSNSDAEWAVKVGLALDRLVMLSMNSSLSCPDTQHPHQSAVLLQRAINNFQVAGRWSL